MHICVITSEFPSQHNGLGAAGVGYYVFNLCNQLIKKGHKTTVFTRGFHGGLCFENINGVDVYRITFLPMYPFHIAFHSIFVNKIFRAMESDFDLVHLHLPLPPSVKTSLPVVVTVHTLVKARAQRRINNDFKRRLGDKIFSVIYSPLELEILHNADLITCVSGHVARLVKDFYSFDSKVIGNGADTDFFVPNKSYHNARHVLWAGRLIYAKGVLDLVNCTEYVNKEYPSVSFLIAGKGPLWSPLRRLLKSRGLEKKVILLGQLDRSTLIRYYQKSAIFVLTSHIESFPNTVLEAMSCGTPVVATKVGDVPKVVKNEETGFLVSPKDPKAMARRIIDLLNDEGLRKRMGMAARKLVENRYSWNSISDKILDCYKLVVGSE